jgi:glycosyltransferase involved in cell wall biosynthesis
VKRRAVTDVAIYSPFAGDLYSELGSSGGAEVQSVQLARALAAEGLRVRHIVHSGRPLHEPGDVELVAIDARYERGGLARRRAAVDALRRADAAVYIQRSAGFETGLVGGVARARGRRFVFSSSSLADFVFDAETIRRASAGLHGRGTRLQYRLGLRLASAVVAQTEDQRALARRLGIEADVIRSFALPAAPAASPRDGFLWVGRVAEVKDPLSFVQLARLVPEARFMMVGAAGSEAEGLGAAVRAAAGETPNLELVDRRPHEELLRAYETATAVVSTSWFEGFPNTFLEGWARGAPALSLRFDPDEVITRNDLGYAAGGSLVALARAVRELMARPDDGERADRVRRWVREHHDPSVVGPRWAALVRRLLR